MTETILASERLRAEGPNRAPAALKAAPTRARSKSRRRRLLAVLVLLLLAAGGAAAWHFARASTAPTHVPTVAVTRGNLEASLTAVGALQPKNYVDVGAQVSGQLQALHVTYGSEVKQGDLLAEIDPAVYSAKVASEQAQLKILKAQIAEQQAQLALAQSQNARNQRLYKQNAVSQDVLQTGEAAEAVAHAQIAALQAQLEQAQSTLDGDLANLQYTKIYAPITGTVVSISAQQGQTLNANQSAPVILRIADLDTMTVWAQVAEADIVKVKTGMPVHFSTLGMPDRQWTGTVRQILPTPEVINDVILYDVLIDVANPDHALMTQMSAQVFFVLGEAKDALLVPMAALQPVTVASNDTGEGTPYRVKVRTATGTETREIRVGLSDRANAAVIAGLSEGDHVVLPTATGSSGQAAAQRSQQPPARLGF
ncbi:MAG TPA: efflux RND transporter periplasmic adaptor subunit [Hypericibacter adhaerens]|jgi:macrolide-specific efflux system membrane fusion protein|uniref:Secretion protein HlyD n=1 Tax=Hypericibacter adhaerens TaxID=2602016 RepID=A0A5J6MT29_9PROT|nr:efflux RND transporter periplasmic adaptor subunit [Hypericibacter adhaerens]QEX20499.1 secretion protein HlyD [Hypericibacter adhaerens]HWA46144.1 efflux RND transporter periplasmic adaptor subunit [Hypericibacter adhaerens]